MLLTGILDKFLSELVSKKNNLKLKLKKNEVLKTISLLLLLKERRAKAFPQIIAIIEQLILGNKNNKSLINNIKKLIEDI